MYVCGGTEGVPLHYGELNVEILSVFVFEGFIRTCQYVLVNNAVVCRRYVCRLYRQSVEGQCLYSESSWEVCRDGILRGFYFISSHYTRVFTYNSVWKYMLVNTRTTVSVMEYYLVS